MSKRLRKKPKVKCINSGLCNLKIKLQWSDDSDVDELADEYVFTFIKKVDAYKAQRVVEWITSFFVEELFCTSIVEEVIKVDDNETDCDDKEDY